MAQEYEELNLLHTVPGWILLIVGSILLVGMGLLAHFIVPDRPRHWDFGQLPDIPGEHPLSTREPPRQYPVPSQLLPLPPIERQFR